MLKKRVAPATETIGAGSARTTPLDDGFATMLALGHQFVELRAKIAIDKNDLDTAVAEQPEVFLKISENYSLCCSIRDGAKDELARKDSSLAHVVRASLEAAGKKDTKDAVTDGILLHKERTPYKQAYDNASRTADQWGDLKGAFEQRMRMLQGMIQLYSVGYFSARSMQGSAEENRTASAAIVRDKMEQRRLQKRQG